MTDVRSTRLSPVGVWSGDVWFGDESEHFTISFAEDGGIALRTTMSTGSGNWRWTEPPRFSYELREVFTSGPFLHGEADVTIDAQLGPSLTGTGTATVRGPDGGTLYVTPVTFSAERESVSPATWH